MRLPLKMKRTTQQKRRRFRLKNHLKPLYQELAQSEAPNPDKRGKHGQKSRLFALDSLSPRDGGKSDKQTKTKVPVKDKMLIRTAETGKISIRQQTKQEALEIELTKLAVRLQKRSK